MDYRNVTGDGNTYNCEVYHEVFDWIPFHVTPDDPEQHGRDLYARITRHIELNDVFNSD